MGARPQFIKAALVSRAIAQQGNLNEVVVHTGQHFDREMSEFFFNELEMQKPHYTLGISGGLHGEMTGRMIAALERVLLDVKPDAVIIYGDTNSTLAGAIAAAKLYLRIAHVEAGLRSFRPMPEEINRVLSDRVSRWLFCPTDTAVKNLAKEGLVDGVHQVGDVMYDAALSMKHRARERSGILARLALEAGTFVLATLHRAENTDTREALERAFDYLRRVAKDRRVIMPLHPRTRKAIDLWGIEASAVHFIDPVGYLDMIALIDGCACVVTDSGGLQKEAYFFRKPCVTMRDATEWVETIDAGWNRLWNGPDYAPRGEIKAYGDGTAAGKVAEILADEI